MRKVTSNDISSHSSMNRSSFIQFESDGFSVLRANVCCALILLTVHFHIKQKRRIVRKMYQKDSFNEEAIAFISFLISPIKINSNDRKYLEMIFKCIISVSRKKYLMLDEAQRKILNSFSLKNIEDSMEGKFIEKGLKVWIHSPENPTRVKMEFPPLKAIESAAPKLANAVSYILS